MNFPGLAIHRTRKCALFLSRVVTLAMASTLVPLCAWAQSSAPGAVTIFAPSQIEVSPYIWALHIDSDDELSGKPLDADLSLGKILSSVRGLGELEIAPRYKRVLVDADGIYASLTLSPRNRTPGLDHINLQAGFVTTTAGYSFGPARLGTVARRPLFVAVQPFVGARYTDLAVTARSPELTTLAHLSQHWWMGVLGARMDAQSGRYLARLEGNFSNFNSKRNGEEVFGAVGYQLAEKRFGYPTLNLAYRYLYEKRVLDTNDVLRAKLQGPLIFLTFRL
jgi:hypothetical protein